MPPITRPPYPTETQLKATKAHALVAVVIFFAGFIAVIALMTLEIARVVHVPGYTYLAVVALATLGIATALLSGSRKRKRRGRARNITGHPPTQTINVHDEYINRIASAAQRKVGK